MPSSFLYDLWRTFFPAYLNPPLDLFCTRLCVSCLFAFHWLPSKAGRGVAFLKLARAQRGRWLVLGEFAKYAFFGLKRKRRDFERSVLKYVSIKIPALTHSGRKSRVCVNTADRLLPPSTQNFSLSPSPMPNLKQQLPHAPPTVQNRCTRAGRLQKPA